MASWRLQFAEVFAGWFSTISTRARMTLLSAARRAGAALETVICGLGPMFPVAQFGPAPIRGAR
jgi:hypothetical protein